MGLEVLAAIVGIVIGLIAGVTLTRLLLSNQVRVIREEVQDLKRMSEEDKKAILGLTAEVNKRMAKDDVERLYVSRETYNLVSNQLNEANDDLAQLQTRFTRLAEENATLETQNDEASKRLVEFKAELENLQKQAKDQFKAVASDIMTQKSTEFTNTNKAALESFLKPFQEKLTEFQKKVEDTRKEDIADLTSLKKEIEQLQKLNNQLSEDAQRLTSALSSDVKVQGDWGEDRLKMILEAEGMMKYLDFQTQTGFRDEDQDVLRKPDYILNLPDGRHLIIDSKVSLNAYVEYFNISDPDEKKRHLKELTKNITNHIDGLSAKNYQELAGLKSPDFVCMFMPIEPALSLAMMENPDILKRAMDKKVVLLTPTNLIATAKMVNLLWQKENRVKNVEEIFKQCGMLYDKFVLFIEEYSKMGVHLDAASLAFKSGMDRLKDGSRKGDTIIGRFEKIRELDAKVSKRIPQKMVEEINLLEGGSDLVIDISHENPGAEIIENT